MKSKVLIYHTKLSENATPDDLDVLDQAKFVSNILKSLGYEVEQRPFDIDVSSNGRNVNSERVKREIQEINPAFIFNLVESICGNDSLIYLAPLIFEEVSIPYTGCTKAAFFNTRTKIETKKILEAKGILTPYWLTSGDLSWKSLLDKKFLIKFNINHASKNLGNMLLETAESINQELNLRGEDFFAEEYIAGREFNISMVGSLGKGKLLPIAEMKFIDWPPGKIKIVDYQAKWDLASEEYKKTKRTFDFSDSDKPLLQKLEKICKKCWKLFGLRGYARIDFRVSEDNIPYVLEINENPCISPDAGFIIASHEAGMSNKQILRHIIKYSCGKRYNSL